MNTIGASPPRKRGRPAASKNAQPKTQQITANVEQYLQGQSYSINFIQTKFGAMKIDFMNNPFEFHFNKNGIQYWRCLNHQKTNCQAVLISKGKNCYIKNNVHNHEINESIEVEYVKPPINEKNRTVQSNNAIVRLKEQMKKKLECALQKIN